MIQSEKERAEIKKALCVIPADLSRSDWLKVTTALKSQGPSFQLVWEEWTRTGKSFKEQDLKVWDNCKNGKISIGTLFHYAKQHGYKRTVPVEIEFTQNPSVKAYLRNDQQLNTACFDYFVSRGIKKELIPSTMKLNEYQENWQIETPFYQNGSNEIVTIHRTVLDGKTGKKVGKRWSKGKLPPQGIHALLCSVGNNKGTIHIAEGIENILSVASSGIGGRFYVAGSADQLKRFSLPENAEVLHIWADSDKSGTGERAAKYLANQVKQCCKVFIHLPSDTGTDFNDLLLCDGSHVIVDFYNAGIPFCDKRRVQSLKNGQQGGRVSADFLTLAKEYVKLWEKENCLTLFFYNQTAYVFNGKCYSVFDGDVKADLMAFLQANRDEWQEEVNRLRKEVNELRLKKDSLDEASRKRMFELMDKCEKLEKKKPPVSTQTMLNVLENLKSFNFCHLSTDNKVPFEIIAPYECLELGHVMSFSNGLTLKMEEYVQSVIEGNEKRARGAVIKTTPRVFNYFAVDYPLLFDAKCPLFLQCLEGWQPEELARGTIQKMMGLSIMADTSYNVAFFLAGEGGTGKSTCLEVIRNLVGSENTCSLPLQVLQGSEGRFNSYLLTENLLNIVGDMATDNGEGRSALSGVEGFLKDTTDGGMIKCELKGKDSYQARVTARHLFATNCLPRFSDTSEGLWDRLRILPFNTRYRGSGKEIKNLSDKLNKELAGIFIWALQGYVELRKLTCFPEHSEGKLIKDKHRFRCDPDRVFLEENYQAAIGSTPSGIPYHTPALKIYEHYKDWMLTNGYRPKSHSNFYHAVQRVYPKTVQQRIRIHTGEKKQSVYINLCRRSE